jgi:hypothetical protein
MYTDGLVAPRLVGLTVCGQEQPLSLPLLPPVLLGRRFIFAIEGVTELGEPAAAAADGHAPLRQPPVDLAEPCVKVLKAALLSEPLGPRRIPADPTDPLANWHVEAELDRPDRTA